MKAIGKYEGAWVAVTPHGVLPRDSHEISPTIGGGVQVADFTRGFTKGIITKNLLISSYVFFYLLFPYIFFGLPPFGGDPPWGFT